MEVLIVLVFVSLVLASAAVVLFIMRIRGGDFEHSERLSLLPLDDDGARAGVPRAAQRPAGSDPDRDEEVAGD